MPATTRPVRSKSTTSSVRSSRWFWSRVSDTGASASDGRRMSRCIRPRPGHRTSDSLRSDSSLDLCKGLRQWRRRCSAFLAEGRTRNLRRRFISSVLSGTSSWPVHRHARHTEVSAAPSTLLGVDPFRMRLME